jgi:hypothetical protein
VPSAETPSAVYRTTQLSALWTPALLIFFTLPAASIQHSITCRAVAQLSGAKEITLSIFGEVDGAVVAAATSMLSGNARPNSRSKISTTQGQNISSKNTAKSRR